MDVITDLFLGTLFDRGEKIGDLVIMNVYELFVVTSTYNFNYKWWR